MDIKLLVATHKKYQMPSDSIYIPLHVGAEGKNPIEGFIPDNTGENISTKNPYYCELTGLYWAWKNLDAEYIGLCHYRRYFSMAKHIPKSEDEKFKLVLNNKQAEELLSSTEIILPKKRNYYIETIYNHYKHTMYIEPLDIAGQVLQEKYPEYVKEFEGLKHTTKMHAFNMFIMKKEMLDKYCTWLFDILGEVEKRVDTSQYSDFHKRFFGRISERLLDVWIKTNHISYKEVQVIDMQNINWANKIKSFLIAKFTGKRYEKSF
ncbi:MAG: DUF4422 domain-containing protein [Treponema sp.]|uniref:DUF4422 domain-containing protein n=1 Tax=Treponema sp. TaxID=166 RepID=UPI0025FC85C5|nr:DUF4422 domain-containing protein [Treponema sp.]MBQ8680485.1 DUF4422 domain-containing protein [Treponema sp.]MBR1639714.1 DUF4422 domain-containing protein [Treponema sp.]